MFFVDVVTLFPEMFAPVIGLSIVGKALENNLVCVRLHNPLDALASGERADAPPYGGGAGMVMRLEPLVRVLEGLIRSAPRDERRAILLTSPAGQVLTQGRAKRLATLDRLIIVCGHYEGIDDRFSDLFACEEISLGDFVLTGGEIVAMAILDATIRLRPGVLRPASLLEESFEAESLEYPAYTRPPRFRGIDVPAVLLSGNHAAIAEWRREQSRERTRRRRPDLSA